MAWIRGHCLWIRCGREGVADRSSSRESVGKGAVRKSEARPSHSAPRGLIFVVRRKLGNAVKRNRLKRRLRSICRSRPFLPGSLVVFCQPPAIEAPFADLERELDTLVPKLPISSGSQ